mgnify:CR=1 FL=1
MYKKLINHINKILILFISILILLLIYYVNLKNKKIRDLEIENSFLSINKDVKTNGDIYMIGNSIISAADWNELLKSNRIINLGFSGITTMDAVMYVDKLLPGRPDLLFIMLGVNDIKVNAPWEVAYENYYNLIYSFKLLSPKTKINIISVLPTNYSGFNNYEIDNLEIKRLNNAISEMCLKYHYNFIDCYDDFSNNNGELYTEFTYDGLHLNSFGYDKLAFWIKPYLQIKKNEN